MYTITHKCAIVAFNFFRFFFRMPKKHSLLRIISLLKQQQASEDYPLETCVFQLIDLSLIPGRY